MPQTHAYIWKLTNTHVNGIKANHRVALVRMWIGDIALNNVIIDGRFQRSYHLKPLLQMIEPAQTWEKENFITKMANHLKVNPLGILQNVKLLSTALLYL